MKLKVVVLGAGFGGLELSSTLSEALGEQLDLTLIDKNDSFFFGFSKLDVMFGRAAADSVRMYYRDIVKPGVQFCQETITAIDPAARRVTTNRATYDADILVVALGADYELAATPGLLEGGNEFYSFAGAQRLGELLPTFTKGHALIGVSAAPFKCPPAPSEAALMLHDYLTTRGVRAACQITIVMPFSAPIPPSPEASQAILTAFADRGITFIPKHAVQKLDPARRVAILDDASELHYDLYLGVPKHRVPDVVLASGMTEKNWIPVNPQNLMTRFPGVYAVGDVTSVGTAKAGVFAEGAAKVAAASILAEFQGHEKPAPYAGEGVCYIEFGGGRIGQVSVNFLSQPHAVGKYGGASTALVQEKEHFGTTRRARWFGIKTVNPANP
jgi:sulfide:quinone oxidoreductase